MSRLQISGTGQSTATAGFNALARTTTRGDIITAAHQSNQRPALGTRHFLGSDGTDAVWQGSAQSGTGASTPHLADEGPERSFL